ncbi:MAG: hypothetical protein ACKVHF_03350 [Candidatus Poseidoniales archaeon]|tara:strand:+ start:6196 stop:6375 length:180 start_codon:yes stop_codon:yes gene_type:complete
MIWKIYGLVMTCVLIGGTTAIVGASVSSFRHYAGWEEDLNGDLTDVKEINKSKVKGGKK